MSNKKISSLEKIGYIKSLPEGANIDDYETINIKEKSGKTTILFRASKNRKKFDEINNFSSSWDVFNSHL